MSLNELVAVCTSKAVQRPSAQQGLCICSHKGVVVEKAWNWLKFFALRKVIYENTVVFRSITAFI